MAKSGQCNDVLTSGRQCPSTETIKADVKGGITVNLCYEHLCRADLEET